MFSQHLWHIYYTLNIDIFPRSSLSVSYHAPPPDPSGSPHLLTSLSLMSSSTGTGAFPTPPPPVSAVRPNGTSCYRSVRPLRGGPLRHRYNSHAGGVASLWLTLWMCTTARVTTQNERVALRKRSRKSEIQRHNLKMLVMEALWLVDAKVEVSIFFIWICKKLLPTRDLPRVAKCKSACCAASLCRSECGCKMESQKKDSTGNPLRSYCFSHLQTCL